MSTLFVAEGKRGENVYSIIDLKPIKRGEEVYSVTDLKPIKEKHAEVVYSIIDLKPIKKKRDELYTLNENSITEKRRSCYLK